MSLKTAICDLLACDVPVLLAGMSGVARSELVAAVSNAGGFGFLGMAGQSPDFLRVEIARVRGSTSRNFGVQLIPAATDPHLLNCEIEALIAEKISAVTLLWDLRADLVRRLRDSGCLVLCQVGSVREAEAAAHAGAHSIIVQGMEAGGHIRGRAPLAELLRRVIARVNIPVLAAGGIADGQGVAAALRSGAQGVMVGTAFLATEESFANDYHKKRIVEAKLGETLLTGAFHIGWPSGVPVRVLASSVTRGEHGSPHFAERRVIGHQGERPVYLFSTDSPLRDMTGNFEAMALYAGEGAGKIASIPPAAERLREMTDQAMRLLGVFRPVDAADELSSPACSMHEVSDTYMGYADAAELIAHLNELLEAERAGARVTLETAQSAASGPCFELLRIIQQDEIRWCAMLVRHIKALGAEPSSKMGAFYGKAMAIADLRERVVFLNRGQAWVAKRLREMLPRVRDAELHADLGEMLKSHEINIDLADGLGTRA